MRGVTTIVKRKPPPKPAAPEHDFGAVVSYLFGDPRCSRCNRALSDVERTARRCATDAEILAGRVFRRVTR